MRGKWLTFLVVLVAGCASTVEGLTPSARVYAAQKEFNELYFPPIQRYSAQQYCDATATPPVLVECADAQTVVTLNAVVQETGLALAIAQTAVRTMEETCKLPDEVSCNDATATVSLSASALRAALARLSTEFIAAGLDK